MNLYLTFDDGPNNATAEVLDTLKATSVAATFFLTGSHDQLAGGPEPQRMLVQRMIDEGHALGNHGFLHFPTTKAEYAAAYGDLSDPIQQLAFRKNFDDNVSHFRKRLHDPKLNLPVARLPADGSFVDVCVQQTKALGLKYFAWDFEFAPNGTMRFVDKQNWQGLAGVACSFPAMPEHNNVLLLHDAHWHHHCNLLESLLQKLKSGGATFKTLT